MKAIDDYFTMALFVLELTRVHFLAYFVVVVNLDKEVCSERVHMNTNEVVIDVNTLSSKIEKKNKTNTEISKTN